MIAKKAATATATATEPGPTGAGTYFFGQLIRGVA
jgi:hypothetical protein